MATNRDLLKEAIADAKSVKEVAIANAKLALEEAFTPHLKSMLSAKLEEMDKEDDKVEEYGSSKKYEEDDKKVEEYGSSKKYEEDDKDKMNEKKDKDKDEMNEEDAVSFRRKNSPSYNFDKDGGPVNPVPHKVGKSTVEEEDIDEEIDLDELLAELDDEVQENKRTDAEQEGYKDGFDDAKDDIENALKKMKVSEEKKDDMDEEMKSKKDDMDEEMKSKKDDMDEEMKSKKDKDDVKEDARTDAEEEGYLDGMKDEKEDMEDRMDDEEIDLEDMSEDDLKGFIEDVIKDMVSAGEIEPGDEFVEDEVEVEDVEDVDVDVEIDEEMKSKKDDEKMDEAKMSNPVMRKGDSEKKKDGKFKPESKPERETEKMREELDATIAEVHKLKDELNEVNLLNAKLLYSNKIFRAKNLNESKKVKVLKAFDKAKDVAQAKTIYETLNEGLLDKSSINENRVKGSASKATGLEPKNSKQPIIESNDVYNRMRQLAGLL